MRGVTQKGRMKPGVERKLGRHETTREAVDDSLIGTDAKMMSLFMWKMNGCCNIGEHRWIVDNGCAGY